MQATSLGPSGGAAKAILGGWQLAGVLLAQSGTPYTVFCGRGFVPIRNAAGAGKTFDFTSQLFFDDSLTDQVHAQAPYSQKGQRTLRNNGDDIFRSGGDQLLLDVSKTSDGYAATFDVGLNMT